MKANLLVIGAGRSGTTSLCHYLKQHEDICFSDIKEVHFFSVEDLYQRGEEYFESYFTSYSSQKIKASADTYLLIDKKAPNRIFEYNPQIKIISLLREPVARAYSSYHYSINNGHQNSKESFLESLQMEEERLKNLNIIQQNNLCHFYGSLYYLHMNEWLKYFPKENILLLNTNELEKEPHLVLQKISKFLQVSPFSREIKETHINKAAPVKSKGLQQFLLNREHPLRNVVRPIAKPLKFFILKSRIIDLLYWFNKKETKYKSLSVEEKKIAEEYFREDLKKLKEEFGFNFKNQ